MKYDINWINNSTIENSDLSLPITQIYCWIYSGDKKIALVSKDDEKWQFPGGKPMVGESESNTLKREINEETSIDLDSISTKPKMFGYYIISEIDDTNTIVKKYLQLRYYLFTNTQSESISIMPNENIDEVGNDEVKFSRWFTIEEAKKLIPWLGESKELESFNKRLS